MILTSLFDAAAVVTPQQMEKNATLPPRRSYWHYLFIAVAHRHKTIFIFAAFDARVLRPYARRCGDARRIIFIRAAARTAAVGFAAMPKRAERQVPRKFTAATLRLLQRMSIRWREARHIVPRACRIELFAIELLKITVLHWLVFSLAASGHGIEGGYSGWSHYALFTLLLPIAVKGLRADGMISFFRCWPLHAARR